jgi:hypothetical protein
MESSRKKGMQINQVAFYLNRDEPKREIPAIFFFDKNLLRLVKLFNLHEKNEK